VAASEADVVISPSVGLVCFAFGAAQVGPGEYLAGAALLRLLSDVGLSGPAARSVLFRMRQQGLLESSRSGREARYRLTPVLDAAQARLARQFRGGRPSWSGSFHGVLYEIPERHRALRDRLRRAAHLLGYVTLRPGLVIATTDRWDDLLALIPARPAGSQVLRTRLTLSDEDSRQVAHELWDLDQVAERYRRVIASARAGLAAAEREPPAGRAAFRAFGGIALPIYETSGLDPDLPEELLPPGWPGRELGAVLVEVLELFSPLLRDYLDAVTGG
jgi:phenylacetic acid degradation operon negative regulatory protein